MGGGWGSARRAFWPLFKTPPKAMPSQSKKCERKGSLPSLFDSIPTTEERPPAT
ncbi:Bifunctional purple acid phosphatase 26 -like protein [Gossypium arboreum]|uniref:Bifunctional purple acid phosphatase 26-like protein n=1 Tax=Gossypium arboreum TaxID=29729 RepID=A0A0B0NW50_GOSAR|nr:Bifunctional purple acid phosphatase 26 -like protein [Gossypium arboreum]